MRDPFSKRELRRVERAAAKLPHIEREVLRLSAREKLDYYQIGEQLDLSVKQVERHLANALCNLDRNMKRRWWQR